VVNRESALREKRPGEDRRGEEGGERERPQFLNGSKKPGILWSRVKKKRFDHQRAEVKGGKVYDSGRAGEQKKWRERGGKRGEKRETTQKPTSGRK